MGKYNEFKDRLIDVLSVESESYKTKMMREFIINKLKEIDGVSYYTNKDNIYVTKGDIGDGYYPCLVSHTDTVHDITGSLKVFDNDDILFAMNTKTMTQTGIGGDDKVGIFVCLEALKDLDAVKCAFFRDEEVGCKGSQDADMNFFSDVGYVFQCDRRGNTDFVTSIGGDLSSKKFQNTIEDTISKFNYKFSTGGLTDVDQLKDNGLNVCVANMSCGYYNPHSDDEVVSVIDVCNVYDMILSLIDLLGNNIWEHKREKVSKYDYFGYNNWYSSRGLGKYSSFKKYNPHTNSWTEHIELKVCCPACDSELIEDNHSYYCTDDDCPSNSCYVYDKTTCKHCGSYTYSDEKGKHTNFCYECYQDSLDILIEENFDYDF